jgi:hypothetical protein
MLTLQHTGPGFVATLYGECSMMPPTNILGAYQAVLYHIELTTSPGSPHRVLFAPAN